MLRTLFANRKVRLAALTLGLYLLTYVVLWESREDAMFALTDHGCFKSVRVRPALRSAGLENHPVLRPVLVFVYYPVNAFRLTETEWRAD